MAASTHSGGSMTSLATFGARLGLALIFILAGSLGPDSWLGERQSGAR